MTQQVCHALRLKLEMFRAQGAPFALAWTAAIDAVLRCEDERDEWLFVLTGMVDTWRLAYDRVPGEARKRVAA